MTTYTFDMLDSFWSMQSGRMNGKKIRKAYELAEKAHAGQTRVSGEPYISHPVAVSYILAELGMDSDTLCAALLHDVVEDTETTLEDISKLFGSEIALLVDGVTKLEKSHCQPSRSSSLKMFGKCCWPCPKIFVSLL